MQVRVKVMARRLVEMVKNQVRACLFMNILTKIEVQ